MTGLINFPHLEHFKVNVAVACHIYETDDIWLSFVYCMNSS